MATHKLATISFKGEVRKFKILHASRGTDIREAIRSRFRLPAEARFILVDNRDRSDVVIDGTLETGSYTLELASDSDIGCCPPGSLPATLPPADYKTQGVVEEFEKTHFYVAGKDGKHSRGIIIAPDVFGWDSGRTRQIADEFALDGHLAIVLDFFGEDNWTETRDWKDLPTWSNKYPWAKVQPVLEKASSYATKHGAKKLGLVGFCWGNWVVIHGSASGKYSAGVSFHPSQTRLAGILGEDEVALCEAVKAPQLLCPAGNDPDTVKKGGLVEKILKKNGVEVVIHEFPDQEHGWVCRGDVTKPEVEKDVRRALNLAKDFFKKHL